jgi:signal transduction histidine kinase
MSLNRDYIQITSIFNTICKQMKPQFKQKGIEVKSYIEDGLPLIYADAHQLIQVFANILANALKFTPSNGVITVAIRRAMDNARTDATGGFVQVSISNEGPGILPHELRTIFERYKQGAASQMIHAKGTGLGLAICKLIVEAHGGEITAESEPDKLTTFRFSIPINQPK